MELGLLVFRLFLAAVFGLAGVAKLADLAGSRKAVSNFGVPEPLVGLVGTALPIIEILIAVALLANVSSWYSAVAASLLLVVFICGMLFQMAKGTAPDCHCFGQIHSEPVGISSIVRNVLLLVPATILIMRGQNGQGMNISSIDRESLQLILLVFGLLLLCVAIELLRRIYVKQDEIVRRIDILELVAKDGGQVERETAGSPNDGLPIGAVLPDVELSDINGVSKPTSSLTTEGLPVLLFFVSPTCSPCKALMPRFEEWADEFSGKVKVVFVSLGSSSENIEKFGEIITGSFLLGKDREFHDLLNAKWTPSALLVAANNKVASHVAAGDTAIIELVEKIRSKDLNDEFAHFTGNGNHSRVEIGGQVPEFSINSIDGRVVKSTDFNGKPTLITFWSPTCPHCIRMADDLKNWDGAKGADEPNLVVFSDGELEPHVEMGLKAPIVLDKGNALAAKLGMHGTPSAILIDGHGRFVSEIAIGAANIWALVGKRM